MQGIPVYDSYQEFLIAKISRLLRKSDPDFVESLSEVLERIEPKIAAADEAEQATNNIRLCQNERNGNDGKAS